MVVVRVLVHGLDVDDVLARRGSPVEVNLAPALGIVLQDLERELMAVGFLDALDHLAVDAEAQDGV